MGLLNRFKTNGTGGRGPDPLPSGSFTVDREGRVISTTIRSHVPPEQLGQIAKVVTEAFRSAKENNLPVQELSATYGDMNLKARDLRGGAIIFLSSKKSVSNSE